MNNPLSGAGREVQMNATRPMSAFVDGERIRLEFRVTDGCGVFVWMTKDDFSESLQVLQLGARRLGVEWSASKVPPKSD
jgi:hypothetical protein